MWLNVGRATTTCEEARLGFSRSHFSQIQLTPSFRSEDLIGIAQDACRACSSPKMAKPRFLKPKTGRRFVGPPRCKVCARALMRAARSQGYL